LIHPAANIRHPPLTPRTPSGARVLEPSRHGRAGTRVKGKTNAALPHKWSGKDLLSRALAAPFSPVARKYARWKPPEISGAIVRPQL